ncbi:XRE family transcriptional regulator [Microbacterium sp. dk485]|uniref:helix-turn-helix domain-containing protein n=1 Tax=Microbacterium sp. dk485 TaxID=2560021 RepID=UPI00107338BC|nr:helix-turn-helix transcriptional regulator [Microbacterium sp. dk485]TFV85096.1 XRE family transcriptional regulator [Microbacterium sp. dk485]
MTTVIGYEWRLRDQMAAAGMFSTTKLIPLLQDRGVDLSASQVYRLVTDKPERLNLTVLIALMDILGCAADDLIVKVDLGKTRVPKAVGESESASTAIRERGLRPRPARVTD